ncbi:helix-turn-helix domain-containing protein [Limnohabitans parvus]|uniref:DNA-binding protein n=1 Tax=Limnohabitans parvus II-B4 TaxID=1293052 RepID=A0A315E2I3_9BURK|nr:helix-turn-helix domain-containing protein [Limnohabitans parvus]PUE52013.1 DNA-binding protein [Limnohabitans parvus II-B4]
MKNSNINQAYFSTSQTAKMLGLSVGTVQRMVENGIFKAYVTQGGHRRILSSSLTQYCKQQGFSGPQATPEKPLICILHDSAHVPPALGQLGQWDHVKLITHPLDLMGIQQHVGTFFIDARIPWLHNAPLHLQDTLMQNAHIVVYNSTHLPSGSPLHLAQKLNLFDCDISTDLVYGYMLGSAHVSNDATHRPTSQ